MATVRILASSETLWVGMCLQSGRMMSDQISSETTQTSCFLNSSMAFSSSHSSQTRPVGLWGEHMTAAWILFSTILRSMSSKSMRQTPSSSWTRGLWTMS